MHSHFTAEREVGSRENGFSLVFYRRRGGAVMGALYNKEERRGLQRRSKDSGHDLPEGNLRKVRINL